MMRIAVISLTIVFCLSVGQADAQNTSDEARRHFDRGEAAIEMAKSPTDYEDAIKEFEQAVRLAPDWPDVYYNLGLLHEKTGNYDNAIKNLTKYLKLSPDARDIREVKRFIAKIEYKMGKVAPLKKVVGRWERRDPVQGSPFNEQQTRSFVVSLEGDELKVDPRWEWSDKSMPPVKFDGLALQFKCPFTMGVMEQEWEFDLRLVEPIILRGRMRLNITEVTLHSDGTLGVPLISVGKGGWQKVEYRKR